MAVLTRFNPSCNGALHLGHVYLALVNEHFARERGGRFIVRFDDLPVPPIVDGIRTGRTDDLVVIDRIKEGQRRDLEWLGIEVDAWYSDREFEGEVSRVFAAHNFVSPPYMSVPLSRYVHMPNNWRAISFQPWYTARRVVVDGVLGCTHILRGEDLAVDDSLHRWFLRQFGYPEPLFFYLPRLMDAAGDIAKHNGAATITEMRENGLTPLQVRARIEEAVLYIPFMGWGLENIRPHPILTR